MSATGAFLSWKLGLAKSSLHINSPVAHASPKLRFSTDSLTETEEGLDGQILSSLPIRSLVCGVGISLEMMETWALLTGSSPDPPPSV